VNPQGSSSKEPGGAAAPTRLAASKPPEPGDSPVVRLKLDPYDGPKSFHASRAFAEHQRRLAKIRKRRKFGFLLLALVVGGLVVGLAIVTLGMLSN